MFRIESYITPIIWSYFSKYVKNFNSYDFQVSLWNGGAVFSNLELNLDVLDSELQLPLQVVSGHVQELKITVPWRKITSEPIVLNVKSMELVLKYKQVDRERKPKPDEILPPKSDPNRNDANVGYMKGLISKIVTNVRVNFENIVIKYIESDIALSINVGEASLNVADENWVDTFIEHVLQSDITLRRKLSFSDVNICLDRCNNAGLVDKFHDPMLYRCDFDVRILQKFETSLSRTPHYYRMDLFLGHLQFCVTDEQIPMLVRLYDLFSWLMQSGQTVDECQLNQSEMTSVDEQVSKPISNNSTDQPEPSEEERDEEVNEDNTWTGWATNWLFSFPTGIFMLDEENDVFNESAANLQEPYLPIDEHSPGIEKIETEQTSTESMQSAVPQKAEQSILVPLTTHFGVYIKTLTIIFKAVQKIERPLIQRRKPAIMYQFLKCSIQGISCDFIVHDNVTSHSLGVSSIMVHGLGFCPCGVQDCSLSEGGECYFEAGRINTDFSIMSLFDETLALKENPLVWCYDVDHKSLLNASDETALLEKSPALSIKYIVTRNDDQKKCDAQQKSVVRINGILYHIVAAPCKVLLCSGLIHRLKTINDAFNNYGYEPYGVQPSQTNIPNHRFSNLNDEMKPPVTTYRVVVRQPLIEILAADHPIDFNPKKRAEHFRKSGGIVNSAMLPRQTSNWPKMVISWDVLEFTAEDADAHFNRLRDKLLQNQTLETSQDTQRRREPMSNDEISKWNNRKNDMEAWIDLNINEVLLTFISEPVELNVGSKHCSCHFRFNNCYFNTHNDFIHRVNGQVELVTVTCSTRLEERCNILWHPLTTRFECMSEWESSLLVPSLEFTVRVKNVQLYVGPETVIICSQLSEKLLVYLQEFWPYSNSSTTSSQQSASRQASSYFNNFSQTTLENMCYSYQGSKPDVAGIVFCLKTLSLIWRYPQKRIINSLIIGVLPFPFDECNYAMPIKLELQYFDDFTGDYHTYHVFVLSDGLQKTINLGEFQRNVIAAQLWRIKLILVNEVASTGSFLLEMLAKNLTVNSIVLPHFIVCLDIPEIELNLVNNTFYAGRDNITPNLISYGMTGVTPVDHIVAKINLNETMLQYTVIEEVVSLKTEFLGQIKVLDFESLSLQKILDPVYIGLDYVAPDVKNRRELKFVASSAQFNIGPSFVHTTIYSAALWNQVISSYDRKNSKMTDTDKGQKIILNRILACNDLNQPIDFQYDVSEDHVHTERINTMDCKAIIYPPYLSDNNLKYYVSIGEGVVDVDPKKLGYTSKPILKNNNVFVNVSNLTSSQVAVKISGSFLMANGLDQSIDVLLCSVESTVAVTTVVPARSLGPSHLCHLHEIDHFRFRLSSSDDLHPWSDVIHSSELNQDSPVSSIFVALYKKTEQTTSKIQVWLSIVTEEINSSRRYLLAVTPIYCLRSWLCGDTMVHLSSAEMSSNETYVVKGKGEEIPIKFLGEHNVTHHMKFQSNSNVPPSNTTVPLLPAGLLLEPTKYTRSIDELINHITVCQPANENANDKWPFVNEELSFRDWNTDINPETEIMVSFTPWIDGLPTAVAEIRPWALFVNLSGVDLLFSQEVDLQEWVQYWVPYKSVFSPKRIEIPDGNFRFGLMMNDFLVKSPIFQFSDEQERLSVKKINKDKKIPIDCYSRLDLFGGGQVTCLTIETRVINKILVVVVRPTYCIQNRAPYEVNFEGVTISSAVTQRREAWPDSKLANFNTLEPFKDNETNDMACSALPMLHFITDGKNYSAETPSYKYMALSVGGPWWFVQLVDCSETSNDTATNEGMLGTKMTVTLSKVDCANFNSLHRHRYKNVDSTTETVVIGSYTKNGQVWVSICQENSPQIVIHNKTSMSLLCAEKDATRDQPKHSSSCFEQYLMIPPKSSCTYSFPSAYNCFPQLTKRETQLPDMLLAFVSQDLIDFVTANEALGNIVERPRQGLKVSKNIPVGNTLFPDIDIEWKILLSVEIHPTQYVSLEGKTLKVSVENLGCTQHVFIESTKCKEVSANYIRSRFAAHKPITTPVFGSLMDGSDDQVGALSFVDGRRSTPSVKSINLEQKIPPKQPSSDVNNDESIDLDDPPPSPPCLELEEADVKTALSWRIKLFLPEVYISVQDDFLQNKKADKEFIGVTLETVMFELCPMPEDSRIRPEDCPTRTIWVYTLRVGNFQIDTPVLEKTGLCEFEVMLQPKNKCAKAEYVFPSHLQTCRFFDTIKVPDLFNIDSTITLSKISNSKLNLETMWLKVCPMSIYIEDRLITYVLPQLQKTANIFNEGYCVYMKTCPCTSPATEEEDNDTITYVNIVDFGPNSTLTTLYAPEKDYLSPTSNKSRTINDDGAPPFGRSISFAPSSSSGINSSNSSIVSSSMSNLRLATLSPVPPSVLLEPHGGSSRLLVPWFDTRKSSAAQKKEDEDTVDLFGVKPVKIPKDVSKLFEQLSRPIHIKVIDIQGTEIELTLHTDKPVYVALDRSVVQLQPFRAYSSITTDFYLGLDLTMHYTVGTIFTFGNPFRVLGSLEILGSPGTLVRTVGTGLKDLVVYPYEGILNGPLGFVSGLGYGTASLLRSVTSGTLVSVTNWAQSVSRNIDRLTLDEQEQLLSESRRQLQLQGFTDGVVQGLSGFGIRILGAVGGIARHPINSAIAEGACTSSMIGGVSRGVFGAVAKPIGGFAEFVALTGQGVLLATGWKPRPQVKKPKVRTEKMSNPGVANYALKKHMQREHNYVQRPLINLARGETHGVIGEESSESLVVESKSSEKKE